MSPTNRKLAERANQGREVVAVGGDHYNTLWVVRSLGLAGFTPTVIVVNPHGRHSFVTRSRYVKKAYVVPDEVAMLDVLRRLSFPSRVAVLSSSDGAADMIDQHYDELSVKYILSNCGGRQGALSAWMDKRRMTELARRVGFLVPWSLEVDGSNYRSVAVNDVPYPCIVKPLKSSRGQKTDFCICQNADELKERLTALCGQGINVLVQEFIKPDFEISILCMRDRERRVNLIPGLLHKVGTCQSVRNLGMPTYAYAETALSPYVDAAVVDRFLTEVDYDGLYSIEFFVREGKAYFLEINLRVDGDLFVYTAGGVNMPALWVTGKTGMPQSELSTTLRPRRTYGMTEVSYVKYMPWRRPWQVVRDFLRTDVFSIWSRRDPMPLLYKFIYALKH